MFVLGLGSNLGNRLSYLSRAVKELKKILNEVKISDIFESEALLPPGSPASWNKKYLNMAIAGETKLLPEEMLVEIGRIEKSLGRSKVHRAWSPRKIDIDILAYDNKKIESDNLIIPHNQLLERNFMAIPMSEIYPEWVCPIEGKYINKTIREIAIEKFSYPSLNHSLRRTELCLN